MIQPYSATSYGITYSGWPTVNFVPTPQDSSNINSPLPQNTEIPTPKPTITPSIIPEIKQESTSKVKALNIGETAIGTNFKITVNGVRSADRIDYIDNIYGPPAVATEGKQYFIIDITLENI